MNIAEPPQPKTLLSTTEQEALASRTGSRRTVYYTKMTSKDNGGEFARTHEAFAGEAREAAGPQVRLEGRGAEAPPEALALLEAELVHEVSVEREKVLADLELAGVCE